MIHYEASAYGKLPLHADFIWHRASSPDVNRFDKWLQEGIYFAQEKHGDAWKERYCAGTPVRFLSHFPGSKGTMVGVIRPSKGKAGRLFPFMLFTSVDTRTTRKQPGLLPLMFSDFLEQAESFATTGWQGCAGLQDVHAQVDALSGSADEREASNTLAAYMKERTTGDLWSSILEGTTDERRYVLLMNVKGLVGPRSRPRFPLRLPPVTTPEQVAFWLTAATEFRGLEGFPSLVLWSKAESGPSAGVRMLLVDPTAEHYVSLFLAGLGTAEATCDLADEGMESEDLIGKAKARYGSIADALEVPLVKMIHNLERLSST